MASLGDDSGTGQKCAWGLAPAELEKISSSTLRILDFGVKLGLYQCNVFRTRIFLAGVFMRLPCCEF